MVTNPSWRLHRCHHSVRSQANDEADFKNGGVWLEANVFSFRHFWGPTLCGALTRVDLTSLTDFKIRIFFVKGEFDLTCPPDLTRDYFEKIRAPRKNSM